MDVDNIVKLLKQKAFIIQKFLDTAFRRPIRFRQKVLMVFSELRWNYSRLKREGRPVAGRPFRLFLSRAALAPNRYGAFIVVELSLLLMRAARRHTGLAAISFRQYLSFRHKPLKIFA